MWLYRSGYDFKRLFTLSEYYDRDRASFYRALRSVREQDMDLTGWLEFFVAGLATQLAEVKARGEVAIRGAVIARDRGLNPRQAGALDLVLAQGVLTLAELELQFPETSRRTLQRDLRGLVGKGLLREVGAGTTDPNRHYEPGEGLSPRR